MCVRNPRLGCGVFLGGSRAQIPRFEELKRGKIEREKVARGWERGFRGARGADGRRGCSTALEIRGGALVIVPPEKSAVSRGAQRGGILGGSAEPCLSRRAGPSMAHTSSRMGTTRRRGDATLRVERSGSSRWSTPATRSVLSGHVNPDWQIIADTGWMNDRLSPRRYSTKDPQCNHFH